ncbi:MAG: glucuronate isomerase [Verrucomicrobia bacterium]|nr:glucuronate isomerase [Verrucomicrobiota bacterium]
MASLKTSFGSPVARPDFLLTTRTAQKLYTAAAQEPIYDYHCHLSPKEIAEDKQWADLAELWLGGDHYKWRAMRANGIPESHITGNAKPYEKFLAYAKTMPRLLRNPLWHWTHLELDRVFGIKVILNEQSAPKIWAQANSKLKTLSAQKILKQFRVRMIGTTDDPCDDLSYHQTIKKNGLGTRVYPAYRPDGALRADQPETFKAWTDRLEQSSGGDCRDFAGFLKALDKRHEFFHQMGSRISDHGLNQAFGRGGSKEQAAAVYLAARKGEKVAPEALEAYRGFLMVYFGELDAKRGWVKQLHFGALRNANTRGFREIGPDTGFDSIGDWAQIDRLAGYLDELESRGKLPKTVLYNLNPADNYAVASLCGNFQGGGIRGKIQFGSGWWFLDQLDGMRWQLNTLSQLGVLANFVGMLTDSRSFLSYPRHEYFRRLLCQILGEEVEKGMLPKDMKLLEGMVRDICYRNAEAYFGMEAGKV